MTDRTRRPLPAPALAPLATPSQHAQSGVVLIITMILLVVMSLLGIATLRNASSTESAAGNVRTTELATEAADMALRHCESSVVTLMGGAAYPTTFVAANILPPSEPPKWHDMTVQTGWDSTATAAYILPLSLVNPASMDFAVYKRAPECQVQMLPAVTTGTSTFYVITARGFGPEVAAADAARSRPVGSEIWLQSHIELK